MKAYKHQRTLIRDCNMNDQYDLITNVELKYYGGYRFLTRDKFNKKFWESEWSSFDELDFLMFQTCLKLR